MAPGAVPVVDDRARGPFLDQRDLGIGESEAPRPIVGLGFQPGHVDAAGRCGQVGVNLCTARHRMTEIVMPDGVGVHRFGVGGRLQDRIDVIGIRRGARHLKLSVLHEQVEHHVPEPEDVIDRRGELGRSDDNPGSDRGEGLGTDPHRRGNRSIGHVVVPFVTVGETVERMIRRRSGVAEAAEHQQPAVVVGTYLAERHGLSWLPFDREGAGVEQLPLSGPANRPGTRVDHQPVPVSAQVPAVARRTTGKPRRHRLAVDQMHRPLDHGVGRGQLGRHTVVVAEYPEPGGLPLDPALAVLVTARRCRPVPPLLRPDEELRVTVAHPRDADRWVDPNFGDGHDGTSGTGAKAASSRSAAL